MFGLLTIMMVVGSGWCQDSHGSHSFVQAKTDFTNARLMIQDLVPHDTDNLNFYKAREHLSGGILAAVTIAVAQSVTPNDSKYDPLSIIQETVPTVFEDYNGVAADPINYRLAEINAKIQPITSIIESLCPGADVESCNAIVENNIKNNKFLQNRAHLLIAIGRVSHSLKNHEKEIKAAAADNSAVSHLIKATETPEYKQLVHDLASVIRALDQTSS